MCSNGDDFQLVVNNAAVAKLLTKRIPTRFVSVMFLVQFKMICQEIFVVQFTRQNLYPPHP